MVKITEINYPNFGRCVEVSNGTIEFVATLDMGAPNIIRFGFVGGENEFFEDINKVGILDTPELREKFESNEGWWIMGGHRLWNSPEAAPRTYYPANSPVKCEEIPNGVRLIPPPQKWTNLQNQIDIMITDDNQVEVIHRITNVGAYPAEFAVWALSVMAQGGLEIVPVPKKDSGFLGNCWIGLWSYTKMNDERVYWGDKYITVKQDPNADCAFKFGISSEHGWAAYLNHGNMFVKYFDVDGKNYPDNGMNYETYTNPHFLEVESLGELKSVEPGETVSHKETWQLFKDVSRPTCDNEAEIAEIVKKYVK